MLEETLDQWRDRIWEYERYSRETDVAAFRAHYNALATLTRSHIQDIELAINDYWNELLSLKDAAEWLGCSYSGMQKKVSRGEIPNSGVKGSPLVKRGHLRGP